MDKDDFFHPIHEDNKYYYPSEFLIEKLKEITNDIKGMKFGLRYEYNNNTYYVLPLTEPLYDEDIKKYIDTEIEIEKEFDKLYHLERLIFLDPYDIEEAGSFERYYIVK